MPTPIALWRSLVGPLGPRGTALVLTSATGAAAATFATTRQRAGLAPSAVTAAVAFDLVGGLVAFQLPATRHRYSRGSRTARLALAAVHLQPFAVPLTREGSVAVAAWRYLSALGATAALERVAARRRRAAAGVLGLTLASADLVLARRERQRWLGPVILTKLVAGHAGIGDAQAPTRARTSAATCSG